MKDITVMNIFGIPMDCRDFRSLGKGVVETSKAVAVMESNALDRTEMKTKNPFSMKKTLKKTGNTTNGQSTRDLLNTKKAGMRDIRSTDRRIARYVRNDMGLIFVVVTEKTKIRKSISFNLGSKLCTGLLRLEYLSR